MASTLACACSGKDCPGAMVITSQRSDRPALSPLARNCCHCVRPSGLEANRCATAAAQCLPNASPSPTSTPAADFSSWAGYAPGKSSALLMSRPSTGRPLLISTGLPSGPVGCQHPQRAEHSAASSLWIRCMTKRLKPEGRRSRLPSFPAYSARQSSSRPRSPSTSSPVSPPSPSPLPSPSAAARQRRAWSSSACIARGRRRPASGAGSASPRRAASAAMPRMSCILAMSALSSGSVATSSRKGPSATQAAATASSASDGVVTRALPAPYAAAKATKSTLPRLVPPIAVSPKPCFTRPNEPLTKTTTMTRQRCATAVASSGTVICSAPSPTTATWVPRPSASSAAAMAAGSE
mmetsp:Transcript_35880/g.90158  ORF Transcript_35880/g.90158 Transcript_35880/m.90158 type:complete len:352 (+) Transcript_35880:646-1701(+)